MPVNCNEKASEETLYQRKQYVNGGVGRLYWDYRDKIILDAIPQNARTIVDAGCGEGITLEKVRTRFPQSQSIGFDIIVENVKICRQYGLYVSRADIRRLAVGDNQLDCCILSEVIEHIPDYQTVLNELYRIVKPGGTCIIVFPNDLMFRSTRLAFLKFKEAFYDPGHVKQWTPSEMRSCLQNAGFTVKKIINTPFYFWMVSLHCVIICEKR